MNTLLKIGKWYWITIFIAVAILETTHAFQHESLLKWTLYYSHIPLMLFIVLLISRRNWLSWLFMACLCSFGLYNLFTWGLIASGPTSMDFNYYLRRELDNHPYQRIASLLTAPEFFYFFSLIVFFTKSVRKRYFNSHSLKASSLQ